MAEVEKGKRVSDIADVRDVVQAVMKFSKTNIDDRGHPDAMGLVDLNEFINVDGLLAAAQNECRKAKQEIEENRREEYMRISENIRGIVEKTFKITVPLADWNFDTAPHYEEIRPGFRSVSTSWNLCVGSEWPAEQLVMSFRSHYTATLNYWGGVTYAFSYASARLLNEKTALRAIEVIGVLRNFFEDVQKALNVPDIVADMIKEYVVVMGPSGVPIELPPYRKTSLTMDLH